MRTSDIQEEDLTAAGDGDARERALDVRRSFLVQAPAGSGKTELLIQRFLALLAQVDRPERVVAMTFTRKAAGEMRERIVRALAAVGDSRPAETPHEARTRELAAAVVARDAQYGWHLQKHPARLSVQTIDSFCAGLARQAPLATRLGGITRFEERPWPLYQAAVREALADATSGDPDWRRILRHFDNDAAATVRLLSGMLGKRDQWLRLLARGDRAAFRSGLEAALAREIVGELSTTAAAFPPHLVRALSRLQRYAAKNADGAKRVAQVSTNLVACADAGGLPPAAASSLDDWRALATWLLRADKQLRKQVDTHDGFPPAKTGSGAADRAAQIDAMEAVLAELAEVPGLADALDAVRRLPSACYTEEAWSVVSSLLDLLPRLAAHLTVAFRGAGVIDFTQCVLGALEALGGDEAPSDLLLALDMRIDHLLIDEFQDTSFTQLELLRRLTAGWQQGDGRTLFAVGDPMQSIYRFREAEVRIFVEAQEQQTVAGVPVECLVLARNFRSHAGLVAWVNDVFPWVLGTRADPWRSTVAFAPATAVRAAPRGPAATLDLFPDDDREAARVVQYVRDALANDEKSSVAVLVRARTHLDRVLPALREAGIAYTAVELDALSERQAILDLVALTHALVQPADHLAWLAVLRAPWGGLVLADLVLVAAAANAHPSRSIAALLEATDNVVGLSEDGRERFTRIGECLRPALASRGRASLASRVRGAWLALGGGAVQDEAIDVDASERYFAVLGEHEVAGDVPDWPAFVAALDDLRAESASDPSVRVQVMTLHRAKGLEFDMVIMPGLARPQRNRDTELLRWRAREHGLLLAPARARGGEPDRVYEYLRHLANEEDRAELSRLMYVGCTRARERVHLTAALESVVDDKGDLAWRAPSAATALARLWSALGGLVPNPAGEGNGPDVIDADAPLLARVVRGWTVALPPAGIPVAPAAELPRDALPFDWAREVARAIGVVAHRFLAQIGREGLASWSGTRLDAALPRIRTELAGEGVDDGALDRAAEEVRRALANVFIDGRGRWLFSSTHADAASEWALAGVDGDVIAHVVLDRSFVADGVRWIVDFKTGSHEGADVETFLDREKERYRDQLQRYARFISTLDARPIMLGLYHPLLRGWREWPFER